MLRTRGVTSRFHDGDVSMACGSWPISLYAPHLYIVLYGVGLIPCMTRPPRSKCGPPQFHYDLGAYTYTEPFVFKRALSRKVLVRVQPLRGFSHRQTYQS